MLETKQHKDEKAPDFKGIGYSKIGYFKEVRSKIKELQKLNLELGRRHSRLEAIFNSINDGVTLLDRNLNVVYANHVQESMFPDVSLVGKTCFEAYHRRKEPCSKCSALKTMVSGKTYQGELLMKSGTKGVRYLEWTTSPIRDPSGEIREIIVLMRDVTKRKEYEYKIMQSDRMAAIGFLAAGIAHEINNPLTSIAGFAEGLLKRLSKLDADKLEEQLGFFQEYLNIIIKETYRCRDIITNLQEFSRDSEKDFVALPLAGIIQSTMALFKQHAKDHGIKIVFQDNLNAGFELIKGRESQLKHLFLTLFMKALNGMESGGTLTLKASNEADQIEIVFADTGTGESGDMDHDVFEPSSFSKSANSIHLIDLSICYSIVQHHKGVIFHRRETAGGNVFVLRFPVFFNLGSHEEMMEARSNPTLAHQRTGAPVDESS